MSVGERNSESDIMYIFINNEEINKKIKTTEVPNGLLF